MSDPLHTDSTVRRTFPTEYSRLLFPVCGGHALWAPRRTNGGGGALGDVGMIVDGAFYKEFNVFEHHPEQNLAPLPLPTDRCNRDQAYNTMMMSSSRDSSIEFHVTGSAEVAGLPLQTLDVQPQITLARERDGLAFLTPPVPTRWDGIDPSLRIELGAWLSAQCQIRPELEGRVIVTEVVRSSGYVGGLILSRHTEVSANLSLGSTITASAGGSVGHGRSLNAMLRGPDNWTPNMLAEYAIILRYTTAVTRPGFLQRVRLKLGLSRSSSSSFLQAHRTSANATNATNQGSPGNTQTGAPSSSAELAMEDPEDRRDDSGSPPAFDIHDICDPSPMTPFLDMVLERHEEVDIAIGDLSVLGDFMARHKAEQLPDPSHVQLVVSVQQARNITNTGFSRLIHIARLEALNEVQPERQQSEITDYGEYILLSSPYTPPPVNAGHFPSSSGMDTRSDYIVTQESIQPNPLAEKAMLGLFSDSNDPRRRNAIPELSAAAAASASTSPTSQIIPLGPVVIPQSEPPTADYMGDEILFVLPSLQQFETWKNSVETTLVVDFVQGDRHSSRSTPKAFLEHVKLVCVRHSRSGRKPYTKKHPERQRMVPSRKVPNGCPATISYRTFEDKPEVHVSYLPQHAHATGAANYEFTRDGRRAAAAARSKSSSPLVEPDSNSEIYMGPSEAPSMHPDGTTSSYRNGAMTPLSTWTHSRPLSVFTPSSGFSAQDDGQLRSPISPMRPSTGLPTSPARSYERPSLPNLPVSPAGSPARTAQCLPIPLLTTNALPASTPVHTSQALPHFTQGMGTHALPMSTPNQHTHRLPDTPAFNTELLRSPMSGNHGLPPHMLSSPVHLPRFTTASPMYTTRSLNITTQLPRTDDCRDPFEILRMTSGSSEQPYGSFSADSADNNGNSLTVPGADEHWTTISSPPPQTVALDVEQTEMHDAPVLATYDDLRADYWRRMHRLFEAVQSQHNRDNVHFSNEALYQLQEALEQLWREAEAQGARNASTESLLGTFLNG